jgi:hypothetical protein
MGNVRLILSLVRLFWSVWKEIREEMRLARERKIKEAHEKAIKEKDQRELEKAIGSDNAGKPSVHRDGVQVYPAKDRG